MKIKAQVDPKNISECAAELGRGHLGKTAYAQKLLPLSRHTGDDRTSSKPDPVANDPLQTGVAYCCDLLSSSRSRSSSDTKRSARCHASSLSPRNVKNFLNTTRWNVVSMAAVPTYCTSVLNL